jgi:hypothetical protein
MTGFPEDRFQDADGKLATAVQLSLPLADCFKYKDSRQTKESSTGGSTKRLVENEQRMRQLGWLAMRTNSPKFSSTL